MERERKRESRVGQIIEDIAVIEFDLQRTGWEEGQLKIVRFQSNLISATSPKGS